MSFVRLYMVVLTYFMIENFHIPDQSCVFTNAIGSTGVSFKHRRLHGLETKYFGILLFAVPPFIAVPNSREFLSYERISHPESGNFMLLLSLTFSCVSDISFNFFSAQFTATVRHVIVRDVVSWARRRRRFVIVSTLLAMYSCSIRILLSVEYICCGGYCIRLVYVAYP